VERRLHERRPTGFQLRVTSLEDPAFTASGQVVDISPAGIGVYLPLRFEPGSVVRLTTDDGVLYGFVEHSTPERSYFRTGIEIVQVLIGGSALSGLLNSTLEEAAAGAEPLKALR